MPTNATRQAMLLTATIAASLFAVTLARAEDGVSADTVVFGQAVVFDGPAAAGAL